jgi:metal-responsive CopG/Arc/MetJ family transcriptional regulator
MPDTISISLPAPLQAELDRFAESAGVSRSDFVREAVRERLFRARMRALREELMPYAEAQGIYTDEDVFRELA